MRNEARKVKNIYSYLVSIYISFECYVRKISLQKIKTLF